MMSLPVFLLARLDEDEAWANAAIQTPGASHWHWVRSETDEVATPDPFAQEYLTEDGDVSLRSVEELRPASWEGGAPLPDFAIHSVDDMPSGVAGHIARHNPARVLADVEAKRRIVDWAAPVVDWERVETDRPGVYDKRPVRHVNEDGEDLLRLLALPYADHPDYRPEWKP